jgi:hypothetical protein
MANACICRGTYEIKVDDLKQDTVVAGEYELQVSDKKKKKAGESDDPQGKIEVRVYYSLLMVRTTVCCVIARTCRNPGLTYLLVPRQESRPPGPGPHTYSYADYLGQIKTGDLVVYSGSGMTWAVLTLHKAAIISPLHRVRVCRRARRGLPADHQHAL